MGQEGPLSSTFPDGNIVSHDFAACAVVMPSLYLKAG